MIQIRSHARRGATLLALGMMAVIPVLMAATASAQSTDCPAGGRGGPGGDAGSTVGGAGGLGFSIGPFVTGATAGNVDASGGRGGGAPGGAGGRGGSGTLPICNQNTNNVGQPGATVAADPVTAAAPLAAAPAAASGRTAELARTGASSYLEVALAGLGLIAGGVLLYIGQPRWGFRRLG